MEHPRETDITLMNRAACGDREALDTLIRRHANGLLTFIHRMIGDRHRAEELFQDVFLAVWVRRASYQYGRPFRPWLYGIAMNKCRAEFRKPPLVAVDFQSDSAVGVLANDPTPAETALASERAVHVARAVARLPEQQRMVVVLRIWNGLSYGEIAEAMRRTQGTVRSHMFHALAAMRRYLEPRMREG